MLQIIIFVVLISLGFTIGWFANAALGKRSLATAKKKAESLMSEAQAEIEGLKKEKLLEASEEIFQQKQELEDEYRDKKNELLKFETELANKDSNIDRKADLVAKKEKELIGIEQELRTRENTLNIRQKNLEEAIEQANKKLETISGLSPDEAKKQLLDNLIEEAKTEAAHLVYKITKEAEENAYSEAKNILLTSMEQIVSSHTIESTISTVSLPSDDMKGRIIGKEGRNIRAFEIVTGVDVIVDDTPQAVLLSAFDPYRRELAKVTMERLVNDGRIHPGRIEETYAKVIEDIDETFQEIGEQACHEIGIHGLHPDILKNLGKLKYRTSYGQNVLDHCKEVAELSGILAAQIGLDASLARRAGILHKIGLVIEKANESDYSKVGHEFLKKYGEHPKVTNAVLAFGDHAEANSPIAIIIRIASDLSRKRPGAQRDVIENYVKRMRHLEDVADNFEGVKTAYAIQAGKEIRIIIDHTKADDAMSNKLANDITQRIRQEVENSNQSIKVHVLREFRSVDYA